MIGDQLLEIILKSKNRCKVCGAPYTECEGCDETDFWREQ